MRKFVVVRVNRDPKDTYAEDTLEAALELAAPDRGDVLEYAIVTARDAGAARLVVPREGWRRVPKDEGHIADEDAEAFLEPIARTLWVNAWADWADENDELPKGGGYDLFDVAPPTPAAAEECAKGIYERVETLNGASWHELYEQAATAPGKHYREPSPEDFAYATTMQILGTGVAWSDNHPDMKFKLPRAEVFTNDEDGDTFHCSVSGGRNG